MGFGKLLKCCCWLLILCLSRDALTASTRPCRPAHLYSDTPTADETARNARRCPSKQASRICESRAAGSTARCHGDASGGRDSRKCGWGLTEKLHVLRSNTQPCKSKSKQLCCCRPIPHPTSPAPSTRTGQAAPGNFAVAVAETIASSSVCLGRLGVYCTLSPSLRHP